MRIHVLGKKAHSMKENADGPHPLSRQHSLSTTKDTSKGETAFISTLGLSTVLRAVVTKKPAYPG